MEIILLRSNQTGIHPVKLSRLVAKGTLNRYKYPHKRHGRVVHTLLYSSKEIDEVSAAK